MKKLLIEHAQLRAFSLILLTWLQVYESTSLCNTILIVLFSFKVYLMDKESLFGFPSVVGGVTNIPLAVVLVSSSSSTTTIKRSLKLQGPKSSPCSNSKSRVSTFEVDSGSYSNTPSSPSRCNEALKMQICFNQI